MTTTTTHPKIIILDFDGTLGDTATCIVRTLQATQAAMGYAPSEDAAIRQTIGLPLAEAFQKLLGIDDDATIAQCTTTYERLFADIVQTTVSVFPGVRETLRRLKECGLTLAIASSRGHNSLDPMCHSFGIEPYLSKIVADEDVTHKKPAPEMVQEILHTFGFSPEEALVVGDTTYDILMGSRAGCTTCGVTYGNHTREQLKQQGATYIIDHFAELIGICGLPTEEELNNK